MPRGGGRAPKKNYKGRSRHFTDEESLREQMAKEKREQQWRRKREGSDEEEGAAGGKKEGSSSSDEDSSSDEEKGHKGVEHLIEIENPNRVIKKNKKLTEVDNPASGTSSGPNLSRREREELQKQQAKERYDKLHMEGKTDEARADLARLALIRKQREEAAKKREEERKAKEEKEKGDR